MNLLKVKKENSSTSSMLKRKDMHTDKKEMKIYFEKKEISKSGHDLFNNMVFCGVVSTM